MKRLAVLLVLAPMLSGCALLMGVPMSPLASPGSTLHAFKAAGDQAITWPSDELAPGDYTVTWSTTCASVTESYQGVPIIDTGKDGASGTKVVTFPPQGAVRITGAGGSYSCDTPDTFDATITAR